MVVGLLGILKAGGAYIPPDPDHPPDRLAAIVRDSAPPLVLAQRHLLGRLVGLTAPVVPLDGEREEAEAIGVGNPAVGACSTDLAYIIYTSGSTGTPKGAMNEHGGICNRLLWMQDEYRLTPDDRVLQKNPFSFDVSVCEFFWPLMVGASMVLARPGGHRDLAYLAGLIRDEGITVVHFVPSMLQVFLEESGLESSCATLRHVFSSGEALPEQVARRCLERLSARLHNLYGPTEAAIEVTYRECRREDLPGPVPIGRPIANMRTYVLDEQFRPVPDGEPGELFLAGVGVGRGYLGRPELTAERFLADPFWSRPDSRMYRTGDLARRRPDGDLEFLGRLDHQVQIRGFRIELGEIEAAMARHAAVGQAVVVSRDHPTIGKHLIAYVVLAHGATAELEALRRHIESLVPGYMVPATIMLLDALPLTRNGKIDRRALPEPDAASPSVRSDHAAPRTTVEERLAVIWADILGIDEIGIHDDFFTSGGHSLLAVRLVARVRELFGVGMPVAALFQAPTIARMAAWLTSGHQSWRRSTIFPVQLGAAASPFFCVPGGDATSWSMLGHGIALATGWPGVSARSTRSTALGSIGRPAPRPSLRGSTSSPRRFSTTSGRSSRWGRITWAAGRQAG